MTEEKAQILKLVDDLIDQSGDNKKLLSYLVAIYFRLIEVHARIDEIKRNMTADSERQNKIRIAELEEELKELQEQP